MVNDRSVMPLPAHQLPENRWEFDIPVDGSLMTFSLPKLQYINPKSEPGKRALEAAKMKLTIEEQYDLVREIATMLNPELGKVIPTLEEDQIDWLSTTWTEASEVTIPESSASSQSSTTTKGPSKRTSSRKASASGGSASKTSRSATSSTSSRTSTATRRSSAN
ncbi:hypothetical protein ASH04_06970 [Rhodococcus sp. Leaf233]|nr:hypothetical protein ASH04_06970 [Rhodococcus sp. Leaf233]